MEEIVSLCFFDAVCITGGCHGEIWKHPQFSCCPVYWAALRGGCFYPL